MIFKPHSILHTWENARMWDTWLYFHDGRHYLFYLFKAHPRTPGSGIGLAISTDGVHFADHGPIIHKADDAVWLGTGMTWRVGDTFLLNFSEERNGLQEIFFAESDDLLHWRRLPDEEYVCRADPRWYADAPMFTSQRWDCIWVLPRDDGPGYIGFLTAVGREGPPGLCGTAGCVVSDDGRHFRAAPPAIETGFWGDRVEVGAVERIGDRYYMLLGAYSLSLGSRHMARVPAGESGMYVLTSECQAGPYRLQPEQPLLLGSSPHPFTYFARFYRCGQELLLNHHTVPRQPDGESTFSPLKAVHSTASGLLSLHWWTGNEALKGSRQPTVLDGCGLYGLKQDECEMGADRLRLTTPAGGQAVLPVRYNLARGIVLEANIGFDTPRGPLSCVGLFVEGERHNTGTVLVVQSDGRLTVGPYDGYAYKPEDTKPLVSAAGVPLHWRLLLRGTHLEVYVDDLLIQCYTLAFVPSGRLGFTVEACEATVSNVIVWEMSLSG
ncbi:MAG: hypothetical protein JWO42_1040 [Chloroflexi bacterium]|nr:hypothetical protein [Chloroflexota bacterium]